MDRPIRRLPSPSSDEIRQYLHTHGLDVRLLQMRVTELHMDRVQYGHWSPSLTLSAAWQQSTLLFAVQVLADVRRKRLEDVALRMLGAGGAMPRDMHPLIVAPYLNEDHLEFLLRQGISGADLCGNAVIPIPHLVLFRSGQPNRFRETVGLAGICRGDSSLVARTLLAYPHFDSVNSLHSWIERLGGQLALSTVSKALKRLDDDRIIERPTRSKIRLIDAPRLLDELVNAYRPPEPINVWKGRVEQDQSTIRERIAGLSWGPIRKPNPVVVSGVSSAHFYDGPVPGIFKLYSRSDFKDVLDEQLSVEHYASDDEPHLVIEEIDEQPPFFDPRQGYASPIQVYLELMHLDDAQNPGIAQCAARLRETVLAEAQRDTV